MGVYYVQFTVEGKRKTQALRDADGRPITERRIAEVAMADILAPLVATDKANALRRVQEAIEDAEAKAQRLADRQAKIERDRMEAERNSRATIADGWELFMQCSHRPMSCRRYTVHGIVPHTTCAMYRSYYMRFVSHMGNKHRSVRLLSEVSPSMAQRFMSTIAGSGASGTFNKYLQFFRCFYDILVRDKVITSPNPFEDIDRAEQQYHSKRPLSKEQIAKVISYTSGEMKILLAMGYFTGLRLGDCCTLLWSEVDLTRRIIERIPRKTAHRVKDLSQASVKIGISTDLLEMLATLPRKRKYVLPGMAKLYLFRVDSVTRKVMRVFKQCGIETSVKGDKGRAVVVHGFHSLRYSYISHNAEAGTPQALIQRNAGHSSPAMTEHYTKVSDATAVRIADVLSLKTASVECDRQTTY